jgi:hypothetical protein
LDHEVDYGVRIFVGGEGTKDVADYLEDEGDGDGDEIPCSVDVVLD